MSNSLTAQTFQRPMDHIAIMRKSWGLTQKIATGQKTIESRWYMNRSAPWDKIHASDTVYFKDSGEPVSLKAIVAKVLQFDSLTPDKVKTLLQQYGQQDGLTDEDIPRYYNRFKDKPYCILIFLEHPETIQPFHISKKGFGAMAAWLTVGSVEEVRASMPS